MKLTKEQIKELAKHEAENAFPENPFHFNEREYQNTLWQRDGYIKCFIDNYKESDAIDPVELLEWLTSKESIVSPMFGGTPELEQDYRFAGKEEDYTIPQVIELFKQSKSK